MVHSKETSVDGNQVGDAVFGNNKMGNKIEFNSSRDNTTINKIHDDSIHGTIGRT